MVNGHTSLLGNMSGAILNYDRDPYVHPKRSLGNLNIDTNSFKALHRPSIHVMFILPFLIHLFLHDPHIPLYNLSKGSHGTHKAKPNTLLKLSPPRCQGG